MPCLRCIIFEDQICKIHFLTFVLLCRLRINGCGIFDVLSFDASNSPNAMIPHFQVNLDFCFLPISHPYLTLNFISVPS